MNFEVINILKPCCFRNLNKMVVHMLGGAGIKKILENNNLISKVNIFFLEKLDLLELKTQIRTKS